LLLAGGVFAVSLGDKALYWLSQNEPDNPVPAPLLIQCFLDGRVVIHPSVNNPPTKEELQAIQDAVVLAWQKEKKITGMSERELATLKYISQELNLLRIAAGQPTKTLQEEREGIKAFLP